MAQLRPTIRFSRPNPAACAASASTCRVRRAPGRFVQRRRGVALIYTALGLATFMGVTAMVVDMGRLYTRRAQAQAAADAAALAGAFELHKGAAAAEATARDYARRNGYGTGAQVSTQVFTSPGGGTTADSIRVSVQRTEPLYFLPAFAALLGQSASSSRVGASATSQAIFGTDPINTPISLGAEYGATNGFANPSVFGPSARYSFGDAYSPYYLNDGKTANRGSEGDPHGIDFKGYDYTFKIGGDYTTRNGTSQVQMEIFDPDSAVADPANMIASWDEQHPDSNGVMSDTLTTYTLLAPKANASDPDVVIAEATYGADQTTNLKWTTPAGFSFDVSRYGPGDYTLRVKGVSGSSENGFQLRAGKPHAGLQTEADFAAWRDQYNSGGAGNGTSFSSRGKAVLNFTKSGYIDMNLGFVPKNATQVLIDKFDTDVGFQSITYTLRRVGAGGAPGDALSNTFKPGTQAPDGQWAPTDVLNVPSDYPAEGAYWFATYKAGAYDTSNWLMGYRDPDTPPTKPGAVKLVD